ncbi:MAG: lipopolysaccharide kinase InaA family protein [Desulfobacterales bacterium]
MKTQKTGPYTIGYTAPWVAEHIDTIIGLATRPGAPPDSPMAGRRKVVIAEIVPEKRVAVKPYARGGLIGLLVKDTYVGLGKSRSQKEFEWLQRVRRLGINAPEPVAFVSCGKYVYTCCLILGEIENHRTLAETPFKSPAEAHRLMSEVTRQVNILVDHCILHVDLHPGNVLIDAAGLPYIIDFDKARMFRGLKSTLRHRYVSRWRRAVAKHRLDSKLIVLFQDGLTEKNRK